MIPVFSEWTQQQMQEAEKKLVELSNSTEPNKDIKNETLAKHQIVKMRQKNYASPDCGAKVLASNPEAQSTSSVLTEKGDEYLLSPCTDRIWFIVELCDSIQAQRVELANFELFSSPLKSVTISVSNRFPTREWTFAAQFDAKNERDVEVFDLSSTLFGKFVRVDLTYTNTEHYCPLSFFRIFGTSEIEAFEVENEPSSDLNPLDDDDEFENQGKVKMPKENLLNRAGAAVMSIVQKAAEVLVKSQDNGNKPNTTIHKFLRNDCMSLSHNTVCQHCSNDERLELDDLISCKNLALSSLMENSVDVKSYLVNSIACENVLGFNLKSDDLDTAKSFLISIMSPKYIAAMCNIIATDQKSLSPRIGEIPGLVGNLVSKKDEVSLKNISKKAAPVEESPACSPDSYTEPTSLEDPVAPSTPNASVPDVENTQDSKNSSLTGDELNIFNVIEREQKNSSSPSTDTEQQVVVDSSEKQPEELRDEKALPEATTSEEIPAENSKPSTIIPSETVEVTETPPQEPKPVEVKVVQPPTNEVKVEQIEVKSNGDYRSSNPPESVFLRLSNRIKTLEKNMTLSTQYLEELSRRYKKQIEELQQSFAKLQAAFESQNGIKRERDQRDTDERKHFRDTVYDLNQRTEYMEVILIVVCVFLAFQTVLVVALFKRISIVRKSYADYKLHLELQNIAKPSSPIQLNGTSRTGRKRSKQRLRKISAPNILTPRSSMKSDSSAQQTPVLSRTVSAPNQFDASMPVTENKENYEDVHAMLEENDDILIPGFEDLKINDDISVQSHELDTASTVSATSNEKHETSSSNKSFKFKRRLTAPFEKKASMKQSSSDRTIQTWSIKAKSESPPRLIKESSNGIHKSKSFPDDDDGSGKFKKSSSFKKLFKKIF